MSCLATAHVSMSGTVGMEDLTKITPYCREPRGYGQSFQFKGIDDFLKGFKKLMAEPSAGDEQESV